MASSPSALNANADAERFVRSIKEECLDRLIPMGEEHFRRAVAEYMAQPENGTTSDSTIAFSRAAGHPDDESCATSATPRRTPQFLRASRVIVSQVARGME